MQNLISRRLHFPVGRNQENYAKTIFLKLGALQTMLINPSTYGNGYVYSKSNTASWVFCVMHGHYTVFITIIESLLLYGVVLYKQQVLLSIDHCIAANKSHNYPGVFSTC